MFSRRRVVLIGPLTLIGGSILAGISQNLGELIAFRTIQGVASHAFIVVGFTIVAVFVAVQDSVTA